MEKIVLVGVILVALYGFGFKRRATFALGLSYLVCGLAPFILLYFYESALYSHGVTMELSVVRSIVLALFVPLGLLLTFLGFLKHE